MAVSGDIGVATAASPLMAGWAGTLPHSVLPPEATDSACLLGEPAHPERELQVLSFSISGILIRTIN